MVPNPSNIRPSGQHKVQNNKSIKYLSNQNRQDTDCKHERHYKSYILVCTDYLTKWVEVKAMKHARDEKVTKILYEIFLLAMVYPKS